METYVKKKLQRGADSEWTPLIYSQRMIHMNDPTAVLFCSGGKGDEEKKKKPQSQRVMHILNAREKVPR